MYNTSSGFSCLKDQFDALGARIFGISRDSVKAHQNFTEKQALTIDLISDKEEILCHHFDVIKRICMVKSNGY